MVVKLFRVLFVNSGSGKDVRIAIVNETFYTCCIVYSIQTRTKHKLAGVSFSDKASRYCDTVGVIVDSGFSHGL